MTLDPVETESKAAFARRIGVSRQHVGTLVKSGLPVDANGDVKVGLALAWIRKNVRPQHGALSEGPDDSPGLVEARTRLLLAQAGKAELDLAERAGELINRRQAVAGTASFARVFRDGVLNFAARQGAELAHEVGADPRLLISALDARLRQMLVDLAKTPMPHSPGNDQ